ncbi:MAG: hypothetical protein ACOCRO_05735 [Halanaerobiales bacterium]
MRLLVEEHYDKGDTECIGDSICTKVFDENDEEIAYFGKNVSQSERLEEFVAGVEYGLGEPVEVQINRIPDGKM